jgi:hypothetical protein
MTVSEPIPSGSKSELVGTYVQSFVSRTVPTLQTLVRIANAIEKPVPAKPPPPAEGEEVPPAVTTLLKDGVMQLADLLASLQHLCAVLAASGVGPTPRAALWGPEDLLLRLRAEWQTFPSPNVGKYLNDALGAALNASSAIADVYRIVHDPQPTVDTLGKTVRDSVVNLTESINTMMMSFRLLRGY